MLRRQTSEVYSGALRQRLPRINISECLKRKFYQDQMSDNNIMEETWDKQNSLNLLRNVIAQVQKLNWITN